MSVVVPSHFRHRVLSDIDQFALVLDIACAIESSRNAMDLLIARHDTAPIYDALAPRYREVGAAIDPDHVADAMHLLARVPFAFHPKVRPGLARLSRTLLNRKRWLPRILKYAAIGSVALILAGLAIHVVGGIRYRSWVDQVTATGVAASSLRQEAGLLAQQAAAVDSYPAGARRHAEAALAAISEATDQINELHIWSADPAAIRSAFIGSNGDTAILLAADSKSLSAARTDVQRAHSELLVAQQIGQYAQTWRDLALPVDLPAGIAPAWLRGAAAMRASLASGDLDAISRADKLLDFAMSGGRDRNEAAAIASTLGEPGRTEATSLLRSLDDHIAAGNVRGATLDMARIRAMQAQMPLAYSLQLRDKPDSKSGVERAVPGVNGSAHFYLLVSAIGNDGRPVAVPVVDTESSEPHTVEDFGIEVSRDTYDAVKARKQTREQHIVLGHKEAGATQPTFNMPVLPGILAAW